MSNIYTQESFEGGINLGIDESLLEDNQYVYGVNVRTRFGLVEPILSPKILTGVPDGKKQGLYAIGNLLILFVHGNAYYRTLTSTTWIKVSGLILDGNVDYIYGVAVPASSTRFIRKLNTTGNAYDDIVLDPTLVTGTPAAFICQDGINRPWIIWQNNLGNAEARKIKDYGEWTILDPEYVPIGRQMMWFNGILFLVSQDGKTIYRSTSGQPLNFAVNIQATTGNIGGDADSTSFAVDYNEITAIIPLNTTSFLVATHYACYSVTLNTTAKIFGEPTFDISFLFYTGVINQFSFVEALGDYLFIDKAGLRSYNAVTQYRFMGKNSVFSSAIASLFTEVIQDKCCCISFDNYIFFSVLTTMGYCNLIFDTIIAKFVSIDIHAASHTMMFAVIYTGDEQILYGLTSAGDIYEFFGATTCEEAILKTKAWKTPAGISDQNGGKNPITFEHKSTGLKLMYVVGDTDGQAKISEKVDSKPSDTTKNRLIPHVDGGIPFPVGPPVICELPNGLVGIPISFKGRSGFKISYLITWSGAVKLASLILIADVITSRTPQTNRTINAL